MYMATINTSTQKLLCWNAQPKYNFVLQWLTLFLSAHNLNSMSMVSGFTNGFNGLCANVYGGWKSMKMPFW